MLFFEISLSVLAAIVMGAVIVAQVEARREIKKFQKSRGK